MFRSIEDLNNTFYEMVCMQFILSASVVCTNIYLLSKQELFTLDFMTVFVFLCCVLAQNFLYCWCGYKISTNVRNVYSFYISILFNILLFV